MRRKIFNSILAVALIVFAASVIFVLGISYEYFTGVQKKQLKAETYLAAVGVELAGIEYFENLETEGYRITWIDPDGNVLFDSEADSALMENHLKREEVKQAMEEGYGESSRYSATLAEKEFYSAKRLSDGSVIRLAVTQTTIGALILGFAQPILIVVLIALVLTFVLASRLAKRITGPINNMDPGDPAKYYDDEDYSEIRPLIRHIARQQEQLEKDRIEIEKASNIRQEFTANASHELKSPLHAISGYAELIENGLVKEEDIVPFAAKIRAEATRMSKLVEDITDLTKLDGDGAELPRERCDLGQIAKNAADSLSFFASEMNVDLETETEPAYLFGVPEVLYSIVYNLTDNAVKYNRKGGKVKVRVHDGAKEIVLSVSDNGIGIPEEDRERIFERFYRVDKSRSKEAGGTGLGLSIVKHGVLIHNAKISVDSEPGKGTEFVVTFDKN